VSETAVLFNPQVVVEPGDYRDLYDQFGEVRDRVTEASDVLGFDLAGRFFANDPAQINDGPTVRPASLALAVAIYGLTCADLRPPMMGGLSLGSIVAAHVGGFMSFRDAVRLTHTMPKIEEAVARDLGMGVAFYYNVDLGAFEPLMRSLSAPGHLLGPCAVTADNQMIVTGHLRALEALNARAAVIGGVGLVIPYGPPAHSPMPVLEEIRGLFAREWSYADGIHDAEIPQICNFTGDLITARDALAQIMVDQYVRTVRWDVAMRRLAGRGVRKVRIIGPGHFVRKSLMFTDVDFEVEAFLSAADLRRLELR
jgi:[acyl-carrier-protein] S-malonyltransferase